MEREINDSRMPQRSLRRLTDEGSQFNFEIPAEQERSRLTNCDLQHNFFTAKAPSRYPPPLFHVLVLIVMKQRSAHHDDGETQNSIKIKKNETQIDSEKTRQKVVRRNCVCK